MTVRRLGGWAVGLVVLTAQPLNRLTAQTASPSQRIDTILIENRNIFDREDAAPDWVARLANRLHMRTRPGVIRRRLLLNRGDPFDLARMEESERALRTLGVFRQVRVDTVRQEDGKLALRAVTADGWSTQPQASFTSVGGDNTWDLGLVERNFLGTATELALVYGRNPDRSRLDFKFINPHFFSRRTLLNVRYSNLSDGHRGQWEFGLPFHETAAPHSLEAYGELARQRVLRLRGAARRREWLGHDAHAGRGHHRESEHSAPHVDRARGGRARDESETRCGVRPLAGAARAAAVRRPRLHRYAHYVVRARGPDSRGRRNSRPHGVRARALSRLWGRVVRR